MIKRISLNRCQVVTVDDIHKTLITARQGYDFCKYTLYNGIFLSVEFHRDNTVELVTNSRDMLLIREMEVIRRLPYRIDTLEKFLFRWIVKLNR